MPGLTVGVRMDPPKAVELLSTWLQGFDQGAKDAHRKWVFKVLEYVIKYSRVDTGRSRSGWTALMDAYGYNYQRSLMDPGDPAAVKQGQASGSFTDNDFYTQIVNGVEYVDVMDRMYGIFGFSPSKGGAKKIPGVMVGNVKTKTMKTRERGISFAEKVPVFESFGEQVWQRFMDNAKEAYERNRLFNPEVIPPLENPPPQG